MKNKKGQFSDLKKIAIMVLILVAVFLAFGQYWERGTSSFSSNLDDLERCEESRLAYLLKPEIKSKCEFSEQTITLQQFNNFEKIHEGIANEASTNYKKLNTQLQCLKQETFIDNPDMDDIKENLFIKNAGVSITTLTLRKELKTELENYKIVCLKVN